VVETAVGRLRGCQDPARTHRVRPSRVRIEDLLRSVDTETHFTRACRPPGGYEPRSERVYPTLLTALIAHGTNLDRHHAPKGARVYRGHASARDSLVPARGNHQSR
jgi:hypothetical protein